MELFSRIRKAECKWHRKAWLVDPNKTKMILAGTAPQKPRHAPSGLKGRRLDPSMKWLFSISNTREEYGPLACSAR
jgi:hypothetical protein